MTLSTFLPHPQESLFDDVVRREKRSSAMDLRIEHQNEVCDWGFFIKKFFLNRATKFFSLSKTSKFLVYTHSRESGNLFVLFCVILFCFFHPSR